MWVIVLFDLPVRSKTERRSAASFRKGLLEAGFQMLQYSVYARPCASQENAATHVRRIRMRLPGGGQVRILSLTDKQFGRMEVHRERRRSEPEQAPAQLEFF